MFSKKKKPGNEDGAAILSGPFAILLRENWGYMPLIFQFMEEYTDEYLQDVLALPQKESIEELENMLAGSWVRDGHAKSGDQVELNNKLAEFYRPNPTEWQAGLVRAVSMWKVWRSAPDIFPTGYAPGAKEAYLGAPPISPGP